MRRTLVGSAIASYQRYATREMPGARVAVRWGDKQWEGTTDEEGFLVLWVEPPQGVEPGWNLVELELLEPDPEGVAIVSAPVLVAGAEAELGVISDIDDTVIATEVTNLLKRAWALFLTEHRTRLPFEGVDAFYAALKDGSSGGADNPIFYVSSSPWNLYEHLDEFMALHRIPAGPLLLRDWGLSRKGFAPGGGHSHKLEKIRGLLETFERLPFILIGDSGQEDAEHYRTIVREFPGRIRCVYIRNVSSRPGRAEELSRIAEEVRAAGSELVAVNDTVTAARHAAGRGWIRWEEVPRVEAHQREDASARTVLDGLERDGG
jgi:phosphatidate phosphatase APP1